MNSGTYKKTIVILRVVLIGIAVLTVLFLVKRDVALSGKFSAEHDFLSSSPFFTDLVPKQRIETENGKVKINQEPVYTTLQYPRPFQFLNFTLEFENPDDLFVAAGPRTAGAESYDLEAVNHPVLNEIFEKDNIWQKAAENGGAILYQKRSADYQYSSIQQFNESPPAQQDLGYYGPKPYKPYLPDFSNQGPAEHAIPLRGGHTFFVATEGDELSFTFDYQDLNLEEGGDGISLELNDWEGETIKEWDFADDGITDNKGRTSSRKTASFNEKGLPAPAIYQIKIKTTDDIVIHSFSSSAGYLVVYGRLNLFGASPLYQAEFNREASSSVELVTNAREWSAMTDHRDNLQEIRLAGETLNINEPFKDFKYSLAPTRTFILSNGYPAVVPSPNVIIEGRGVFAFDQSQYFSPDPWLLDHTVSIEELGIHYVLTSYQPPQSIGGGIYSAALGINLTEVFAPDKKLRMQISVPQLKDRHSFYIRKVRADFESEPVTLENFSEKFSRFFKREFLNQ